MSMMVEMQDRLSSKSMRGKGRARFCKSNECGCEEVSCEEKLVCTVGSEEESKRLSLSFQVAAVSKPLLA
eukprot:1827590-Karenia_brevis.AAC.1